MSKPRMGVYRFNDRLAEHHLDQETRCVLRKRRMLLLDAFKGHLIPAVTKAAKKINIGLVVISRGMT